MELSSVPQQKAALRKEILDWRRALSPETKSQLDAQLLQNLLAVPAVSSAELILVYCATKREISLWPLIEQCLSRGTALAAPRCQAGGKMDFVPFSRLDQLQPGFHGILEPEAAAAPLKRFPKQSVCLLPALGADRRGFRLGYGGGYYDRFLAQFPGLSVALIYQPWLMDCLPTDPFDQPVSIVVTPEQTVFCSKNR